MSSPGSHSLVLRALLCATACAALYVSRPGNQATNQAVLGQITATPSERYLIELSPGETRWVSEEEKWALKRDGLNFMDITYTRDLGSSLSISAASARKTVAFPSEVGHKSDVEPMLGKLSKLNMRDNLEKFTSFYTRYYKSSTGAESAEWLLGRVNDTIMESGLGEHGTFVRRFDHRWGQPSLIATIPGRSNKTIVIGAHLDSANMFLPSLLPAPGADDDGSGTVTILEALRVLLQLQNMTEAKAENTVEFHWYSAEEGGLLGSQAVFHEYAQQGRDVRAMLQQDMTGYVQHTLDAGKKESVGVITDYVDEGLTEFIKKVITAYCDIPYSLTECGYACSDHASASKAGYPSAFVIESEFRYSDSLIHTSDDKMHYLSFDHMLQHAKLTLALAYELAFAKLE